MINNYPYGSLITKGLGYDNNVLITSFFSLITVTVTEPPPTGPVISPVTGGSVYVPYPEHLRRRKRLVTITLKVGQLNYNYERLLDIERAHLIVTAVGFLNKLASPSRVIVNSFRTIVNTPKMFANSIKRIKNPFKVNVSDVKEAEKTINVKFNDNDK